MNFINSWAKGNKKETICDITVRLGRITILEIHLNLGVGYRLVVANFGVEF